MRDSVTTAIVNSATRDDSRLWTTTITTTPPTELQNNHNNNNNTTPHSSTSNSDISISENRTETLPSSLHQNYISINESTSSTTAATSANEETAVGDDLFLTDKTRYWPGLPPGVKTASDSSSSTGTVDPFAMARDELSRLAASIRQDLIGTDHFVLNQAASYFFDSAVVVDGGKKIRPMMVLLLSRALADSVSVSSATTITDGVTAAATTLTAPLSQPGINNHIPNNNGSLFTAPLTWQRPDLPAAQRRLAEISEMIHTASLFHDDVIDGSDTRRGAPAVHVVFGNKMAILAGDYLLARASICLARLRHVEVVETMSTIIEHLVRGEVMQLRGGGGGGSTSNHESSSNPLQQSQERINYYLRKNFYKTGSLMANSCKSTALLGNYPLELVEASYRFGKHVGMSFQLVDDVLDFEGTLSQLGKPALADLNAGLATAPVLFAAEEFPELEILIDRKFKEAGDVNKAVELVFESAGIERTKELARVHAEYAMNALLTLNQSDSRDALIHLANKVVARTK